MQKQEKDVTQMLFSVYDSKSKSWSKPFCQMTVGAALRDFTEAVNQTDSMLCKYPADYTLFHVGGFCEYTGTLFPIETPVPLGLAQEFLVLAPQDAEQLNLSEANTEWRGLRDEDIKTYEVQS